MKEKEPEPVENKLHLLKKATEDLSQEKDALPQDEMEKVSGGIISSRDASRSFPTGRR